MRADPWLCYGSSDSDGQVMDGVKSMRSNGQRQEDRRLEKNVFSDDSGESGSAARRKRVINSVKDSGS